MTTNPVESLKCKDCAGVFQMSAMEKQWFVDRQLQPPKRCPDCRRIRKANRVSTRSDG